MRYNVDLFRIIVYNEYIVRDDGEIIMQNDSFSPGFKYNRVLQIYTKLLNGEIVNKSDEALHFKVDERSIQRDIDDLRVFFRDRAAEGEQEKEIVYSRSLNGYYLKTVDDDMLTNSEVLAVCKILLESRAFCKDDISLILDKIIGHCVPKSKKRTVMELISNELFHYVEPHHGKHFIDSLWALGEAVIQHRYTHICYEKQDGSVVERMIKPVGIMFSEYYFYLTAFIENIDREKAYANKDDTFPTIYRIDRIKSFEVSDKHFDIPYKDRFEEGEFRKRIQFMYGGKLRRIKFLYSGKNVESVLDRLPTAKITDRTDEGYIISAEVFGDGVDMWLRSQGNMVKLICT